MSDKPGIEWHPVPDSSTVRRIGYDHAAGHLAVEFTSGGTYHYHGVPHATFAALKGADSVGKYLHRHVKGKFRHSRA